VTDKYVAAVDLGTSGVRCVIFDRLAVSVSSSYREIHLSYPQPGWVEQDPDEIFEATLQVIKDALLKGGISTWNYKPTRDSHSMESQNWKAHISSNSMAGSPHKPYLRTAT